MNSGVVVSSAQLDFGPEELRHFTCASSARIWFFALCFLHIGEYRLDLTILARHIHNSTGISLVVARL